MNYAKDQESCMDDKAPPPSPDWVEGKEWEIDKSAQDEKSKWPDQAALDGTKVVSIRRFIQHSGIIAVCMMWFFAIAFTSSIAVWLIHFLTTWTWLDNDQLAKIQTVIFSGSLGAVVTTFAQKHIALGSSHK